MPGYMIWRNTNIHWRILAFRLLKIFQQFSTIWQNKHDNILCYFNQCMTIIFVQNKSKRKFDCFVPTLFFSQWLVLWSRTSMEHGFFMGFFLHYFPRTLYDIYPPFHLPLLCIFMYAFLNKFLQNILSWVCPIFKHISSSFFLSKNLPKELIKQSKGRLKFGLHCYAENLLYPGKVKNFWNL